MDSLKLELVDKLCSVFSDFLPIHVIRNSFGKKSLRYFVDSQQLTYKKTLKGEKNENTYYEK
jgi:hypothetical protein